MEVYPKYGILYRHEHYALAYYWLLSSDLYELRHTWGEITRNTDINNEIFFSGAISILNCISEKYDENASDVRLLCKCSTMRDFHEIRKTQNLSRYRIKIFNSLIYLPHAFPLNNHFRSINQQYLITQRNVQWFSNCQW